MKVLHISFDASVSLPANQGIFYNMLAEFSKYWERIDIITPRIPKGKERSIHSNVFIHPSPWKFIFQTLFILLKGSQLIKQQHYDVIILHSGPPFLMDIGALILSKRYKIPIMLEIMHVVGYPKAGSIFEIIGKFLTEIWVKLICRHVMSIRVINSKDSYPLLIKWGVQENKIRVIPAFYINYKIFKPLGLPKVKHTVLFVGRLVGNKGIFELLNAILTVKKQYSDIKIIIVGKGPLDNKIRQFISKNSLERNVQQIRWIGTQENLAKFYNKTEILVMTSYNEGGPRVTLEAMACGTPVVTTPVGVMKEIIKDGENGLFVGWNPHDIAEKIILLLNDYELRKIMGMNGKKSVSGYEMETMIKNYAETYQHIITR